MYFKERLKTPEVNFNHTGWVLIDSSSREVHSFNGESHN